MKAIPIRIICIFLVVIVVLITLPVWHRCSSSSDIFTSQGYDDFPEECPLHRVKTVSETVPNYGFITVSHDRDIMLAKAEQFPLDTINNGYGHPDRAYKWIRRKYCPECRRAREAWSKKIDAERKNAAQDDAATKP